VKLRPKGWKLQAGSWKPEAGSLKKFQDSAKRIVQHAGDGPDERRHFAVGEVSAVLTGCVTRR